MIASQTPFADYVAALEDEPSAAKVFPCVPNGKAPATAHGLKEATADLRQLRKWAEENPAYNVGLDPHSLGLCVVDIDGQDGEDAWADLQIENGQAPPTATVHTPRGGRHLYFQGVLPSTAGKLGSHIDTRASGTGYVLIPPSVVGGKAYRHDDASPPPTTLPEWVAPRLQTHHQPVKAVVADMDLPQNVQRAAAYLRNAAPAVEGQGGDNRTYIVACEVLTLGVSPEVALDLMEEHWNPRCEPPWDTDDLTAKLAHAQAYQQNEPGAWALGSTEAAFGEAVAKLSSSPAPAATGPVPFRDVLTRTVAPVAELIPGLLERNTVTFLSAPGASHKSRLALQWGLCLDSGTPVFGRAVEQGVTFVYLSYEDHADEVARRTQAISRRLNLPSGDGHYLDLTQRDAPLAVVDESGECRPEPFHDELRAFLRSIPGHKFIVADGTYNVLRFAGAAKINETSVMAAISFLQRLCDETDSTLLALWHPSQAGQERGDASGWSVAWHNAPRARLSLTAVKDSEDAFELKVEKRNHGAKGKPLTLHFDNGAMLPRSEAAEGDQGAHLTRACVRVACMAAEAGAPIQMNSSRVGKWQLDEIERDIGRRPTQREVKDALAAALPAKLLVYVRTSRHRVAGYYPPEEGRAQELAREAKAKQVEGETHV